MTTPTPPIADGVLGPLLLALRDCLCAELGVTMAGPACRCYIDHNQSTPLLDACTCQCEIDGRTGNGDAWVRVVREDLNLGQGLGVGAGQTFGWNAAVCPLGWIVTVELGVVRCHPVSADGREPVDGQVLTDNALSRRSDVLALRRVAKCCPALEPLTSQAQSIQPLGGAGDCSGSVLTIQVEVPDKDRCVERTAP